MCRCVILLDLIPLKIIIMEVIENLGMDSENLKFVSGYTVYEDNNGVVYLATSSSMNTN